MIKFAVGYDARSAQRASWNIIADGIQDWANTKAAYRFFLEQESQ